MGAPVDLCFLDSMNTAQYLAWGHFLSARQRQTDITGRSIKVRYQYAVISQGVHDQFLVRSGLGVEMTRIVE